MRHGHVAGSRHLLGALQRHGLSLIQGREAIVFLLGQHQVRLGKLQAGLGLLDRLLHLIRGEFQRLLRPGLVRLGGGKRSLGDFDLDRNLDAEPREAGFLPPQFGLGFVDLGSGQVDFVAIKDRIDLRQHLSLLDTIVLLNQETAKAARDGLRSHVDDVGLDERVFGFRTQQAGANPALQGRCDDQHRHDNPADDDPSPARRPSCGSRGDRRAAGVPGDAAPAAVDARGPEDFGACRKQIPEVKCS